MEINATASHGKYFQGKARFLELVVKNKSLGELGQKKKSSRNRNIAEKGPKIRKV